MALFVSDLPISAERMLEWQHSQQYVDPEVAIFEVETLPGRIHCYSTS